MRLDEEKKKEFIDWLNERGAADFTCTICHSKDFAVLDETTMTGPYSTIGVICSCCKNILLFNYEY